MRRVALLFALLLAAPALAGCLGASSSPVSVTALLPLNDAQPGRATEFAFHLQSLSQFRQDLGVGVEGLPEGWTFEPEVPAVDLAGRDGASLIVRVTPSADATYGPHALQVLVGDTRAEVIVNVKDLGTEPLRSGMGTQLYYVGWRDDGTLFGYNEPTVHTRGVPHVPPGEPEENATVDFTPLKVYVGGKRGTSPPEPYNGTGYRPVIPGFDARLRDAGHGGGMVAGETLAVRIPMEQAYTYAGNEEHVLYGENLNFLIRIVSVDVLETRTCDLPVCPSG